MHEKEQDELGKCQETDNAEEKGMSDLVVFAEEQEERSCGLTP